jgi:hypothetical protein
MNEWASVGFYIDADAHFEGYDCWAEVPETPRAILKCNESVLP